MKKFTVEASDMMDDRLTNYQKYMLFIGKRVEVSDPVVLFSDRGLPACYMQYDVDGFHFWDAYGRPIDELAKEFEGAGGFPSIFSLLLYIYTYVDIVYWECFTRAVDEEDGYEYFASNHTIPEIRKCQHAAREAFKDRGVLPHPFTFEDFGDPEDD